MLFIRILINYFIKEDGLILVSLENLNNFLLISFGAIIGANTRFKIYQIIETTNINNNLIILLINSFSSFFLGLFLSFLSKASSFSYSYELGLFFSIGLLGSLSSFSSFIYDLYQLLIKLKYLRALQLFITSLIAGILFFTVGFLLGM